MKNKTSQCLLLSVGIFFYFNTTVLAQNKSDTLNSEGKFHFSIYNLNYLRDYEYFSPILEGYTLCGSIVQPAITFNPSAKVSFSGGVFIQQNFGDDSLRIRPTFLLTIRNSTNDLSFGNYRNTEGHQLIEPLWFSDNLITDNIENGFNLKQKFNHIELNNWIDWNRSIKKGSKFQEKVFGGITSNIFPLKNFNSIIIIPLQTCIEHTGGQINEPDTSFFVTTVLNADIGIKSVIKNIKTKILFNEFSVETYYVFYKEFSPNPHLQFTKGNGIWAKTTLKSKNGMGIEFAFWQGNDFISSKGNALMQSVSSVYPDNNYSEKKRKLLFFTLKFEKEVAQHINLLLSAEPYYDLGNKLLEYGIHFHLNFILNEDQHLFNKNELRKIKE